MFFPPVCRWKNNLYELHRYRKLCRRDTDGSDNARTGAVMEVQETDNLGVQLYFDETSYRTMFEALEDTLRSKGNRLAELRTYCWEPRKPVSESSTP